MAKSGHWKWQCLEKAASFWYRIKTFHGNIHAHPHLKSQINCQTSAPFCSRHGFASGDLWPRIPSRPQIATAEALCTHVASQHTLLRPFQKPQFSQTLSVIIFFGWYEARNCLPDVGFLDPLCWSILWMPASSRKHFLAWSLLGSIREGNMNYQAPQLPVSGECLGSVALNGSANEQIKH